MMDNKKFWALIDAARDQAGADKNHQASLLVSALVALGVDAIMAFDEICRKYVDLVIDRVDFGRSDLINDIQGEHYLRAFAYSLIGQGEDDYYRGLAANDAGDAENVYAIGYLGEPVEFIVPTAYLRCTGEDHPDWMYFSEYLAVSEATTNADGSDDDTEDAGSEDILSDTDFDEQMHFLAELPLYAEEVLDQLEAKLHFLKTRIAAFYYQLPGWKQQTKAGIALVDAASQIKQFAQYVEDSIPDLLANIKKLVPDESQQAPGHTAAP